MRLFVAVEIENPKALDEIIKFRDAVLSCAETTKSIKGVENENLHITIRFLGEVKDSLLDQVKECLDIVGKLKSFTISIKGVGAFPSTANPRVVWVGVERGSEKLKEIHSKLEPCLRRFSRPDRSEFIPHITVARIKRRINKECMSNILRAYTDKLFGESTVTKIVLKQSILRPSGPLYVDLYKVKLSHE